MLTALIALLHPGDVWVAQQLREATPFGQHPQQLIFDYDSRFELAFGRVARARGIEDVPAAYRH